MNIEKKLTELANDNIAKSMLDSGSAYGYKGEKRVIDFDFRVKGDCLNTWYLLKECLTVSEDSEKLNRMFKAGMDNDTPYLVEMESFAELMNQDDGYLCHNPITDNTYNHDNDLNEILQYVIFHNSDKYYVILQIHNGCDVRGGYSSPYLFEVDIEQFLTGIREELEVEA